MEIKRIISLVVLVLLGLTLLVAVSGCGATVRTEAQILDEADVVIKNRTAQCEVVNEGIGRNDVQVVTAFPYVDEDGVRKWACRLVRYIVMMTEDEDGKAVEIVIPGATVDIVLPFGTDPTEEELLEYGRSLLDGSNG